MWCPDSSKLEETSASDSQTAGTSDSQPSGSKQNAATPENTQETAAEKKHQKPTPALLNRALNLLLFTSPLVLLAFYFQWQPFNHELARRSIELGNYKSEHQQNFLTAARALDGKIIKPGETFSFNRVIGPRTYKRGYLSAPGYLGQSRVATTGGGICLISSCLYQAALLSGLTITERHPHNRRVNSVAPGLDATVWYGQSDLKIKNDLSEPVQIRCSNDHQDLIISLNSSHALNNPALSLRRREIRTPNQNLLVEVYLDGKSKSPRLISRDSYLTH